MDKTNSSNKVFIATSIDGYVCGPQGELDWLESIPNPYKNDMGYSAFMQDIDAILMGRNTLQSILNMNIAWPYDRPVFVWSDSMKTIADDLQDKVQIVTGSVDEVLQIIHGQGYYHLYIDGPSVIQQFLSQDKIDEMTITQMPFILGGGVPLFGITDMRMQFDLMESNMFLGQIVQNTYSRNLEPKL